MGNQVSVCTIFTLAAEYETPDGGFDFQFLDDYIDLESVHCDAHIMLRREKYEKIIYEGHDLMPELWKWIDCPEIQSYPAYDDDPVNFKVWAKDYDGNTERFRIIVRQTSEAKYRAKAMKWFDPITPTPTPAELRRASASDIEEDEEGGKEQEVEMVAKSKSHNPQEQQKRHSTGNHDKNNIEACRSISMSTLAFEAPSSKSGKISNSASLASITTSCAGLTTNSNSSDTTNSTCASTPLTSPPDSLGLAKRHRNSFSLTHSFDFSEEQLIKMSTPNNSNHHVRASAAHPAARGANVRSSHNHGRRGVKATFELGYEAGSEDEEEQEQRRSSKPKQTPAQYRPNANSMQVFGPACENEKIAPRDFDSLSIVAVKDGRIGYVQALGQKMRNRRNLWKVLLPKSHA